MPSASDRSSSICSMCTPRRRSTPCSRWRSANTVAISRPRTASSSRRARRIEEGDLGVLVAGGRGDLETDPAAADDHQALAGAEGRPDRVGVGPGAQREGGVGAGNGDAAGLGPGRQHQRAVRQAGSVCQLDLVGARVDRHDIGAATQLDVVLGVPRLGMHDRSIEVGLAGQVVLGQRRTLVGQLVLGAEEDADRPGVAGVAQRFRGLGSGQPGSHDHDARRCVCHGADSFDRSFRFCRGRVRRTPAGNAGRRGRCRAGWR